MPQGRKNIKRPIIRHYRHSSQSQSAYDTAHSDSEWPKSGKKKTLSKASLN